MAGISSESKTWTIREIAVGDVMIRCPNTGQAISTGMTADRPSFGSTPVFFSRTYCPICRTLHEWFAKEAWLSDGGNTHFKSQPARRAL
jgi:hypothetical protein